MNTAHERLRQLEEELQKNQNKQANMKRRIPIYIIIGIVFSFLYPYFPGRRGRPSLAESYGYIYAVIFSATIFFILVPIIYYMTMKELQRKIQKKSKEIKSLKYRIENEPNTL